MLSPHPRGDLPVHDGRRHLAGAHLRRRSPLALRLCAWWLLLLARAHSYNHDTACLCALVFGSQLQELQGRLKKAILEYVVLAGSPLSPYPRQPAREVRCVLHAELHVWRRGSGSSPGRAESPPEGGSTSTRSGHRHPAGAPRRRSPLARARLVVVCLWLLLMLLAGLVAHTLVSQPHLRVPSYFACTCRSCRGGCQRPLSSTWFWRGLYLPRSRSWSRYEDRSRAGRPARQKL